MVNQPVFESLEYNICLRIRHLDLLVTKARRIELEHLGVTPPQIGILHFVQQYTSPCTVLQLRQRMLHSNSSTMALLKRMEKKGLLYRRPDSKDGRYTRIFLTEKGKSVYRKAMHLNVFDSIVTGISENDKKQLQQYIEVLIRAAESYEKQPQAEK